MFNPKIIRPDNGLVQSPDPWWMVRIKDFDGIEIISRKLVGYNRRGEAIFLACDPVDANSWAVLGRYRQEITYNACEPFFAFSAEIDAREFREWLYTAYPHLLGSDEAVPLTPSVRSVQKAKNICLPSLSLEGIKRLAERCRLRMQDSIEGRVSTS